MMSSLPMIGALPITQYGLWLAYDRYMIPLYDQFSGCARGWLGNVLQNPFVVSGYTAYYEFNDQQFIQLVPSVTISPSSAILDIGQSQLFTYSITFGTFPFIFQWYLNGVLVPSPTPGVVTGTWTFTPTSAGSYTVWLVVTDSFGRQATSNVATVTVNGQGVHEVVVASAWCSKTVIGQGYSLDMNLTVADLGSYMEPFNVTVYANDTLIGTSTVIGLPTGMSIGLNFGWNTTGFAYGNYTLSAYISLVAGETNIGNNSYMCGHITITIPGDINGDFNVNLQDLVEIVQAYNSKPGDSNWNPNADIGGNGKVDLVDLIILATNYGKTV